MKITISLIALVVQWFTDQHLHHSLVTVLNVEMPMKDGVPNRSPRLGWNKKEYSKYEKQDIFGLV